MTFPWNKSGQSAPAVLPDGAISPELQARVAALQSRNAGLRTAEDAVASAQEAGLLVGELFKSLEAATKKGAPQIAPADDYDPDKEGFDPSNVDDGGADPSDPEGDDPESPLPAPALRPAPRAPQNGKGGKWSGKFAKSLETLAQGDVATATALAPLFDAIEGNEQSGLVTNDYLEQLGGLLSKSMEGMQVIAANQQALADRLDALDAKVDERNAELVGLERANSETLQKSLEPMMNFVQNVRQSPQGTPLGRAKAPDSSIMAPALNDAVPVVQNATERFNGFTRSELKKSIEGAVRSGHYLSKGLNVSHFTMLTGDTPLEDLPQVVYEVASAELKRPLPVVTASVSDDE